MLTADHVQRQLRQLAERCERLADRLGEEDPGPDGLGEMNYRLTKLAGSFDKVAALVE